jgi:hypothetical protein
MDVPRILEWAGLNRQLIQQPPRRGVAPAYTPWKGKRHLIILKKDRMQNRLQLSNLQTTCLCDQKCPLVRRASQKSPLSSSLKLYSVRKRKLWYPVYRASNPTHIRD